MCFTINNDFPKAKVAVKDIKCYKIMSVYKAINVITSFYHSKCKWELNKCKNVRCFSYGEEAKYVIFKGLHSYCTLKEAKNYQTTGIHHIVVAIIPKGTRYYQSHTRYVSTALKLIEVR